MKTIKTLFVLLLAITMLIAQTGAVSAGRSLQEGNIDGTVTAVTCNVDDTTGTTTFLVTVAIADGTSQTVLIDQNTAVDLKIIAPDTECSADALLGAIGLEVSIDPKAVITEEEEPKHPVALALSLFFTDITDYDAIMAAHEEGNGFGVIAQALWMATKMEGDSDTFLAIINAKKTGDYSAFALEDGSAPQNWGQFKKAISAGDKKGNLGAVMSEKEKGDKGNKDKEKGKVN